MSKKIFTLKDLEEYEGGYVFPGSKVYRTKKNAEDVLELCNYQGDLTDEIRAGVIIKIIRDINKLKNDG